MPLLAATALRLQSPQRGLVDISGNLVAESINGITACFLAGCTVFFGRSLVPIESAHAVASILNQMLAGHDSVMIGVLKRKKVGI